MINKYTKSAKMIESKILYAVTGNPQLHSLEKGILNTAILASAVICALIMIEAIAFGHSLQVKLFFAAFGVFFAILYMSSKKNPSCFWHLWIYLIFNFIIILFDWSLIYGNLGIALNVFIALSCLIAALISGRYLLTVIFSQIAMYIFFLVIAVNLHGTRPHYVPTISRSMETFIETGILAVAIFIVSYLTIFSLHLGRTKEAKLKEEMDELNKKLIKRNTELENAVYEIRTLKGSIPICASCKKIRDDKGSWNLLEAYLQKHSYAKFTHGICPECSDELYGDEVWYVSKDK